MRILLFIILIGSQMLASLMGGVPLGRVWERVDTREGAQANRFCKAGSIVYAVGNGGSVWKTADLQTWTTENAFTSDHLNGVISANGVLVAVGASGRILRKPPGSVWGAQPSGVSVTLRAVTHGGGQFVAVGDGGTVVRSNDGVTWSVWPSGFTSNLHDVIWDGVKFRAVGLENTIASALPGGAWVKHAQPATYVPDNKSISFDGNRYVINGTKFSTDGEAWSFASTSFTGNDMAAGGGVHVSVGDAGAVAVSPDGVAWSGIQTGSSENLIAVEWTGTEFLAMTATRTFISSADGYRWRHKGLFSNPNSFQDGCWTGSQYVVVSNQQNIYTSPDGRWWTSEMTPAHGALRSVCEGDGVVVAVGDDTSILHSSNGRDWHKVNFGGSWSLYDVHWTGTEFIAVGTDGIVLTSTNGSDWKMNCPGRLDTAVWDGNRFLAFSGRNVLQSTNGNDWLPLTFVDWPVYRTPAYYTETMNDMVWTGTEYVAVGDYGWILKSTDGLTWTKGVTSVTSGSPNFLNDVLYAVASSGSRFVTVGRNFIGYSDDGLNWKMTEISYLGVAFADVTWNGSTFMAVRGNSVMSSSNGIDWTVLHMRTGASFNTITWSGTLWVTAGSTTPIGSSSFTAMVATSPDGITWTTTNGDAGSRFLAAASTGGLTVAIDSNGKIKSTASGIWTDEDSGLIGTPVSLLVANGGFQAFSTYGMTSRRGAAGSWLTGERRVSSDFIRSIVSGNGIWVAAGNGSSIMTTLDGKNWTKETFPSSEGPFSASVWTGTKFQIVSTYRVYQSSTGFNWTSQANQQWSPNDARCIVRFNNQTFVGGSGTSSPRYLIWKENGSNFTGALVGNQAVLSLIAGPSEVIAIGTDETFASQDGIHWSILEPRPQIAGNLTDVIHTPLGYFAAGGGGNVWQSSDGETWSKRLASDKVTASALAWGNGRLVGVGSGLLHSADGIQWAAASISNGSTAFTDVAWGGGRFVAVQAGGAAFSSDGTTWQRAEIQAALNSVVWTGSSFIAGTTDGAVLRSADGGAWSYQVLPDNSGSAAHGNGTTVVSTAYGRMFRSTDGENWDVSFTPSENGVSESEGRVGFTGGKFFYFHPSRTFFSTNGVEWTRSSQLFRDIVWTGSQFVGVADYGKTGRSADGITWSMTTPPGRNDVPTAVVWTGSQLIAAGSGGSAFSSPDGAVWTPLTTGTTHNLVDVVWTGTQAVALDSSNSLAYFTSGPALPAGVLARDLFVAGGTLMAACDSGRIARLEGGAWTVTDTGAGTNLNRISTASAGYLAVGDSGTILVNPQGQPAGTWTLSARSAKSKSNTVKVSNATDGGMISLGSDGRIRTSASGRVWSVFASPTSKPLNSVTKVDGDLLAVGDFGQIFRIDANGASLPENSQASTTSLKAIASSGNRLVVVGDGGLILLSKSGNEAPFGYDRWSADQGSLRNPLEPDGDLDQDGVKNMVEYLFGFSSLGPTSENESNRLPTLASSPDGPRLDFEMFTGYQDADVKIQRTPDFVSWVEISRKIGAGSWAGPASVTESAAAEGRTRISVIDQSPPSDPKVFYRIEVRRR